MSDRMNVLLIISDRALNHNERVSVRTDAPWMAETFRKAGYVTGALRHVFLFLRRSR